MNPHFRAFSFVDRIAAPSTGSALRGEYVIPPTISAFPVSLVAEAVGQLAAWSAMSTVDFSHRPVAGIAGRIELISSVRPGQVLTLSAAIESVDTEMVGYSGTAELDGVSIMRLQECVGPMMPVEEFDDTEALRHRFNLLTTCGARPNAFGGLPNLELEPGTSEPGRSAQSVLRVPTDAPFFGDHFPRRPVFPGTLLMHANLQTASLLAASGFGPDAGWIPRVISNVKLRTFISPGETLTHEAREINRSSTALKVLVESRSNGRLVGSAEIEFHPEVK